jgi:hypothetical protein
VKEGISMRELTEEQAVGMCLVYLGKAYEQSFETKTDGFIYGCAETALEHDSLNLNAMLLKTEVLEERLWSRGKSITQLQNSGEFREYEALVAELYNKGYREMPQDMKNLIIRGLQKDEGGIILKDNTPTGFQTIDEEGERYATLSWGLFDEVHEPKDVERYGRALFDTRTQKIVALTEVDSLYNRYPMDIGVFAMAVDPLTIDYPMLTPYQFASNTPIWAIDLEGLEAYYSNKGSFLYWGEIQGDNAPVIIVTTKIQKQSNSKYPSFIKTYETLFIGDRPLTHFEFQQTAAFAYNETYPQMEIDKYRITNTILHRFEKYKGRYSFQQILDNLGYVGDSHADRMANIRKIEGTKSIKYADFFNTPLSEQDATMKLSNKAAINAFSSTGMDYAVSENGDNALGWLGTKNASVSKSNRFFTSESGSASTEIQKFKKAQRIMKSRLVEKCKDSTIQ